MSLKSFMSSKSNCSAIDSHRGPLFTLTPYDRNDINDLTLWASNAREVAAFRARIHSTASVGTPRNSALAHSWGPQDGKSRTSALVAPPTVPSTRAARYLGKCYRPQRLDWYGVHICAVTLQQSGQRSSALRGPLSGLRIMPDRPARGLSPVRQHVAPQSAPAAP